jgi:hypothetical protein
MTISTFSLQIYWGSVCSVTFLKNIVKLLITYLLGSISAICPRAGTLFIFFKAAYILDAAMLARPLRCLCKGCPDRRCLIFLRFLHTKKKKKGTICQQKVKKYKIVQFSTTNQTGVTA